MAEPKAQISSLKDYAIFIAQEISGSTITTVNEIKRGVMTFKFAITLSPGECLIVRFYPISRSSVVHYEPDILHRCAELGLPVPAVIADSRTGPSVPFQYMVYKMIDGVPLSERFPKLTTASQNEIARQIVNYLYALQEIQVLGFGELADGSRALFQSWNSFMRQSFIQGIEAVKEHCLFPEEIITNLEGIAIALETFREQTSHGLVWGDISTENLLIDDHNRIVGLLDFEGALAGDILMNPGYCYAGNNGTCFFESLINSWPEPLKDDEWKRIYLYSILRTLRIAKFAHLPLPTGYPRQPIERTFPGFQKALNNIMKKI